MATEYEIRPASKFSMNLQELWTYKELFYFFTWRDIKVKYKQTLLGFVWAVLQPLLLMVVFTVFFGSTFNIPSDGMPYPVFVYSGLILWGIFSNGLSGAANSMVINSNIIKKIYFPRLIIPLSAILVALFDFLMALIVYIGILIYFKQSVSLSIILVFPLSVIMASLAALGSGLIMAAMNVKYRDFRYIIPFLIQILFFLTPVIYPVKSLKFESLQFIMSLNPMTGAISLFRSALTGMPIEWMLIIPGLIFSICLFVIGLVYFRKTEYYFADLV